MNAQTPVIFCDGTAFFDALAKEYTRHDGGYFILAPSGAGKTYFVERQAQKDWIDGDILWPLANADKTQDGWVDAPEVVMEVNNKCDVITHEAKKLGFWVVGSSNNFLRPDAIVLPDWETHQGYIAARERSGHGGGATTNDLAGVKAHREWIRKWEAQGVPCFTSIQAAAAHLAGLQNHAAGHQGKQQA